MNQLALQPYALIHRCPQTLKREPYSLIFPKGGYRLGDCIGVALSPGNLLGDGLLGA